jgi:hypothetical protein
MNERNAEKYFLISRKEFRSKFKNLDANLILHRQKNAPACWGQEKYLL